MSDLITRLKDACQRGHAYICEVHQVNNRCLTCQAADVIERLSSQLGDCAPYLKEGETPAECIARNRHRLSATKPDAAGVYHDRIHRDPETPGRAARAIRQHSSLELAAQLGHPNPCTLGPLCPYCEIERLSSKLDKAVEDVQRWKDEAANWKSEALADTAYRAELRKEVTALRRRLEIEPDADGHCRRCGLEWPDESETTEPHECPPGFM